MPAAKWLLLVAAFGAIPTRREGSGNALAVVCADFAVAAVGVLGAQAAVGIGRQTILPTDLVALAFALALKLSRLTEEKLELGIDPSIRAELGTALVTEGSHAHDALDAIDGRKGGATAVALALAFAVALGEAEEFAVRGAKGRAAGGWLGIDGKETAGA